MPDENSRLIDDQEEERGGLVDKSNNSINKDSIVTKVRSKKRIFTTNCCKPKDDAVSDESFEDPKLKSFGEVNRAFFAEQSFELWIVIIIKLFMSMILLIDDLTFLLYCQYEYGLSISEAGVAFCISALCLFAYGLAISGYMIDKLGVKISLMIGLVLYSITKFIFIFAETKTQLYIALITIAPLSISILIPVLTLAVKKLTSEANRPYAFSIFLGAMVLGAIFGGPIVDYIRKDFKTTTFNYTHHNDELDIDEERQQEFSAWRTIAFVGFVINVILAILLCFYNSKTEDQFAEDVDWGK